jgi:pseudouridine-5'-phosphate glycosidase
MIVVCAGAKAILDLPATLEYLETAAIPVIGYKTDEFPAFYSLSSGLPASVRADSAGEIVSIAQTHWGLGLQSAVLVVQPPPVELAIPNDDVIGVIQQALDEAVERQIRGQDVTPFLLSRVSALTGGMSMKANLALLRNNARLAGQIAVELCAD